MKRWLPISVLSIALTALAFGDIAQAGQIWTDGNGDGLPDPGQGLPGSPSTNVTIGVWIDAQSFTWTNFLAYIEWSGQCISYVSASYVISGGSNFPIDNFSHPRGIGFGGSGYAQGGIDHIGNVTLHINTPVSCCVSPIIDVYNPYYVFSQLGAGSAYMLFSTNPFTCYPEELGQPGACCFPDGSCIVISEAECQAAGGTYQGAFTDCSVCPPPPIEACCFPDCSCIEAPVGQCPPGSVPQGQGTTCTPNLCECPPPIEACCFADGSCVDALFGQCPTGSVGQGVGTSCATVTCPPPVTGACCLPDVTCLEGATFDECNAAGGLWYPNTPCDQACKPDAVEPKSWGKIKGLYR
jgi:hypothetical protein